MKNLDLLATGKHAAGAGESMRTKKAIGVADIVQAGAGTIEENSLLLLPLLLLVQLRVDDLNR